MDRNCIFCKILNNESPGVLRRITDNWATLVPLEQISKGHMLVIPTFHAETVMDIEDKQALNELGVVVNEVSKKQLADCNADGINILSANRKAAQQSVMHFHIHIVPRYKDDNLDLWHNAP